MLHKVFKLREAFPAIAKESIEKLSKQRMKHAEEKGFADSEWAEYKEPSLTTYCPDTSEEVNKSILRTSILICPGGGYEMTSFREAEPVALAFTALGYNAFVLNYECAPVRYPQALLQVSAAMAIIRQNAELFHVDANKIVVCGFSAGGHLAASLGMFWDEPFLRETLGIERGANRPNAMILGYPVISSGQFAHRGSFEALLGENASPELLSRMSLENQISEKTPPAFIWHTFNDELVPVENTLLLANELREHNITFELHIFSRGWHGLSLCNKTTSAHEEQKNMHCANWLPQCDEWLDLMFKKI